MIIKLIREKPYSALSDLSNTFSFIFIWTLKKIHMICYTEMKAPRCDNTPPPQNWTPENTVVSSFMRFES